MDVGSRKPARNFSTPRPGEGVICAPVVNHYVRICEAQGIPREQMLAVAGVAEAELNPADAWVGQSVIERLFQARLRQWPDPMLGLHFAAQMEPAMSGLLGFMALSCPSILELHNTLRDFGGLVSNIFTTAITHLPGRVLWTLDFFYTDAAINRHSAEWVLSSCAALTQRLDPQALLEVHLGHPALLVGGKPHADYAKAFNCPLVFNQPKSALVLDPQCLNRTSPNGNALVYETLCRQGRLLLEQLGARSTLADRVRREIRQLLSRGQVSRDEVCRRIGISHRHLHRQLQTTGSSYQTLLDELRMESARQHLARPDSDLNHLSTELGFASAKSFSRWFTTQQGSTPSEYRKLTQTGTPGG